VRHSSQMIATGKKSAPQNATRLKHTVWNSVEQGSQSHKHGMPKSLIGLDSFRIVVSEISWHDPNFQFCLFDQLFLFLKSAALSVRYFEPVKNKEHYYDLLIIQYCNHTTRYSTMYNHTTVPVPDTTTYSTGTVLYCIENDVWTGQSA
jgi:hypothetical protein